MTEKEDLYLDQKALATYEENEKYLRNLEPNPLQWIIFDDIVNRLLINNRVQKDEISLVRNKTCLRIHNRSYDKNMLLVEHITGDLSYYHGSKLYWIALNIFNTSNLLTIDLYVYPDALRRSRFAHIYNFICRATDIDTALEMLEGVEDRSKYQSIFKEYNELRHLLAFKKVTRDNSLAVDLLPLSTSTSTI